MTFVHYLNGTLYLINAILWTGYAGKPLMGVAWFLTGLASFWVGRQSRW